MKKSIYSVVADYNGIREDIKLEPDTYFRVSLDGEQIRVEYKDGWPEGFFLLLEKLESGELNEVIFDQIPKYSFMFDSWDGPAPLVRPSDPIQ